MKDFLVSIIMPVYNVENYVRRALLSVFHQSYKNIELIVVDDCGSDNSMVLVEEVVSVFDKNNITRIFHHTHNRGLSAARNTGIDKARGSYLYFIDSDDEITSDCIEKLVHVVCKYPCVDIVTGNMSVLSEGGEVIDEFRFFSDIDNANRIEYLNDKVLIANKLFNYSSNIYIPAIAPNKLYNKRWLYINNIRFVEGLIHEDEKFLFDTANYIRSIGICYDATYLRYINPNSIMTSISIAKSVSNWLVIIESSYLSMEEPLLQLKIRYCIAELRDLLFDIPLSFPHIVNAIKRLILKVALFSCRKKCMVEFFYCLMLACFPVRLKNYNLFYRLYRRLYRRERFLLI